MDFKEVANQMKELEIKASKYDDLKESIDKIMEQVNNKLFEINVLLSEISPMLSIKRHYNTSGKRTGWGAAIAGYIEKIYKYLIDNKNQEFGFKELKVATGLESLTGGSESKVKEGLSLIPDIHVKNDPNFLKRRTYSYTGKKTELDFDFKKFFVEKIKHREVGEMKVDEDDENIKKQMPEKVSHMG